MTTTEIIEPWLARDEGKRAHYSDDPYFWEGWASFLAACPEPAARAALRHLTFLLVKPEAIAGRRIAPILGFLSSRGYRVIAAWPVRMGRHEVRNLWRYQLNVVPIAHVRALEMVVSAGELFLVGLDHPLAAGEASAAESLSRAKGSSGRPPASTLRDQLGCPTLMINFAHAPDEPADVLRELAVLCDARQQAEIIATLLAAGQWPAARLQAAAATAAEVMTARYERSAAHDLDVAATFQRMRESLRRGLGTGLAAAARTAIEVGLTAPECALDVVKSLEGAGDLPDWDRIVTAAYLVDGLRTGRPALIGPPP